MMHQETVRLIMISPMHGKNLSYAAWNISNKAETSSLFDSSCTKKSGFTDDDLSDSGRYIKEKIESSY